MLIKIEDVIIGDFVCIPLYLIENTRLPFRLFRVTMIESQLDLTGETKYILRGDEEKSAIIRSKGKLVQFRGRMRDNIAYYKTGDRLPIGDLRVPMGCIMFEEVKDLMMLTHEVLTHFQFIEFSKESIKYMVYHPNHDKDPSKVYIAFDFMHFDVVGQVHILLTPDSIADVSVIYEQGDAVCEWKTDNIDKMSAMVLE